MNKIQESAATSALMAEAAKRAYDKKVNAARISLTEFAGFVDRKAAEQYKAKHLKALAKELELVESGHVDRLMVFMPPRHWKSSTVSEKFPAWFLGRDPRRTIIHCSYSNDLAEQFSRSVRDTIQSNRDFNAVFPDCQLATDQRNAQTWALLWAHRATYRAAGVGGGITGRGADLILIDDPVADEEAVWTEDRRESLWRWYQSKLRTRLEPGGRIILIMTRWHEDDLAGRLIEEMKHAGEKWKIVSFPATAEPESADGVDTLGRKYGEALWPERYNVKELVGLRSAVSERVWNSQYQQRPSTQQGNMILADNILEGNPPEMKAQVRGWDLASTKGKGDFTVGVLVGLGEDGNYWILDVVRKQLATNERDEMIRVTSMVDGMEETIQRFPQDPGAAGKSLVASITRMLSGHRLRFKPISGDKTIRADPMSSQVNQGHFRMIKAEWNSILVDELKMFPNGRHDDIVDALADAFTTLAEETTKRQVTVNWDVF